MNSLQATIRSGQHQQLSDQLSHIQRQGDENFLQQIHDALFYAVKHGSLSCARVLLAVPGVNPDHLDDSGNSLLYLAVKGYLPQLVALLRNARSDVNICGSGNCTPLHLAARTGLETCLEELLLFPNCNTEARDSSGCTALTLAVRNKQYIPIRLLLDHPCDVNVKDFQGRTALHYGCHTAVAVASLLGCGADINAQDHDGCTPLFMAATEGLDGVVRTLSESPGIDVNISNKDACKTPLHILAQKGHAKSVRLLVQAGADVNLLDSQGRSALYFSVVRARHDVTALLLQANGKVDTYQLQHWMEHAQIVPSLRHLCRKWLRHHLDKRLFSKTSDLGLPVKLQNYILMSELGEVLKG